MEKVQRYLKEKNQTKIAGDCNVSQTLVWKWAKGDRVASENVINLAKASEWILTPHEIRPDLYPNKFDGLPDEMRCTCESHE